MSDFSINTESQCSGQLYMNRIELLATRFRNAIEAALDAGEFRNDVNFSRFPSGCCGHTSDLLAKFFYESGIRTWYISGEYKGKSSWNAQSHAWLQTDDGTIIDITGDQFKNHKRILRYEKRVYVGEMDHFHRLFEMREPVIGYEQDGPDWLGETKVQRITRERYEKIQNYL